MSDPERVLEEQVLLEVRRQMLGQGVAAASWSADQVRGVLEAVVARLAPEQTPDGGLVGRLMAELVGFGPLDELLARETIDEIMVNGPEEIFVETAGLVERHSARFRDEAHLRAVLERLLAVAGVSVNESRPAADGTLPDGSRLHVVIPPMARRGPLLAIRRFPRRFLTMDELTGRCGSLPSPLAAFLGLAVRQRTAILIIGGAGVGKTTLLNALTDYLPERERVVTLEQTAELRLALPNWISLECVPSGPDGRGGIDLRQLVRSALRLRPDRLLVGECLGPEAFDLLQAMNAGHSGSMTTLHASSATDALQRMLALAMSSGVAVPAWTLMSQLSSNLQLIVHLVRSPGGARRVASVTAVHAGPRSWHEAAGPGPSLRELARAGDGNREFEGPGVWMVADQPDSFPGDWPAPVVRQAIELLRALPHAGVARQ